MASTATRTAPLSTVRIVVRSTGSGRLLWLFLLDLERGPTGVVAALLAGVVRQLGLVATRARLEMRHRNRQVGAAIALSGVRDFPLGNTHWCAYSLSRRRELGRESAGARHPIRDGARRIIPGAKDRGGSVAVPGAAVIDSLGDRPSTATGQRPTDRGLPGREPKQRASHPPDRP